MSTALPAKVSVAIVGGGIQGLACAYGLATRGVRHVLVLDAGYWQGGASGRNGTLIRAGFSSPEWTRLFGHSHRCWMNLSRQLGHNVMFSRRGYVTIAETEATAEVFEAALGVHRDCGVTSWRLDREGLGRVLPAIAREQVRDAIYFPDNGVAPHHAAMKGYLEACRAAGITARYHNTVTGIERAAGRAAAILVGDTRIEADAILVAAGGHNIEVAAMAGVELDGKITRIEACALEPMRPFICPGIALIDRLVYLHQTARGEIVGGADLPGRPRMSLASDLPVMAATARHYAEMFPALGDVRILRQWAGMIHETTDLGPLLGPHPDLADLWLSAGWAYGYAGGPGGGDLMAEAIATGRIDDRIAPFAIDRFRRGRPVKESAVVVSS